MANDEELMSYDTFMLELDDGTEQEFAIIDEFDYGQKHYLVVSRVEGDVIDEDMTIYEGQEDGDDIIVTYIEDEAAFNEIAEYYNSLFEDETEE